MITGRVGRRSDRLEMRERVILSVVLAAFLAGSCGKDEPELASPAPRDTVRVAAASNVRPALDRIVELYEARRPEVDVTVAYGASGTHYAQIANGGPFDVFLSADEGYPKRLFEAGLCAGEPRRYASGRLVLWAVADRELDLGEGLGIVGASEVTRVAIANPAFAPYGRAAQQALRSAGVDEVAAPKLVLGDSVMQAAQFVESGAADVGVISLSLALSPGLAARGRFVEIPSELYEPIRQDGIVLRSALKPDLAADFFAFLTGADADAIWSEMGYVLPESHSSEPTGGGR